MSDKVFSTTIRVLYGDTDAAGVVYNANYLRYFEAGRSELMREWVCSYHEIEERGFILPVTETWARYKAPAHYDDLLTVETMVEEISQLKCKFSYKVYRKEDTSRKPKLLVKGYSIHVAITKEGKLTRLPDDILHKFAQCAVKAEKILETAQ